MLVVLWVKEDGVAAEAQLSCVFVSGHHGASPTVLRSRGPRHVCWLLLLPN